MRNANELPLLVHTPLSWAEEVLASPLLLLNDHAHLERKAANNALELLPRWPDADPPKRWVQVMISVAKDEISHLGIVTRILERRGGTMTRSHKNQYAFDLRALLRLGQGERELVDRLLVSALIELRSCERFYLLSKVCTDAELKKLYRSLWASEHGHFKVFLQLAQGLSSVSDVEGRWKFMLREEGKIISKQAIGPRMHSWIY